MSIWPRLLGGVLAAGLAATGAQAAGCPSLAPPLPLEAQPLPAADPVWQDHYAKLAKVLATTNLGAVRTLFVGDSITEGWAPPLFQHFYGGMAALNLGLHSDNTRSALWRLAQLPLGTTLKPGLVVLLIGTNDLWPGAAAPQVATGVAAVLDLLRTRLPDARIVLVGLLPRGQTPADPMRALVRDVNAAIRGCADGRHVVWADPGPLLLDTQGVLTTDIAFDYLHPTWLGYALLSAGLQPFISRIPGQ